MKVEQHQSDTLHRLCLLQKQNLISFTMRVEQHQSGKMLGLCLLQVRTESNEINKIHNESRNINYVSDNDKIYTSSTMRVWQHLQDKWTDNVCRKS